MKKLLLVIICFLLGNIEIYARYSRASDPEGGVGFSIVGFIIMVIVFVIIYSNSSSSKSTSDSDSSFTSNMSDHEQEEYSRYLHEETDLFDEDPRYW